MSAPESKINSFRLSKRWIWVLASSLIIALVYVNYHVYYSNPDLADEIEVHPNPQKSNPSIPSLYEILFIIQTTGADFNPNLVNNAKNYKSYTSSAVKAAINIGVYSSDIAYLSSYGRTQQALDYMDVCIALTEVVHGRDVDKLDVLERFENNLSNPDSLIQILNQFDIELITYLNENERMDIGALILAGAFIEVQYITIKIIDTYPKNVISQKMRWQVLSPLVSNLRDQKISLAVLIELLENVDSKGDFELMILNELNKLNSIYNKHPKYIPEEPMSEQLFLQLFKQISQIREDGIS